MYYPKLDALRGLAALFIVLFHAPFTWSDTALPYFRHAYLFVDLFFMLSGFVLSHRYTPQLRTHMSLLHFTVLRLARIYPLHAFMLAVFLLYGGAKLVLHHLGVGSAPDFTANNASTFLSHLFLLQGLGLHDYLSWNVPSWSISSEFFTYLIFALLLKTVDDGQRLDLPACVSLGAYAALPLLGHSHLDITHDHALIRCIAGFYAGVFLYRLQRRAGVDRLGPWIGVMETGLVAAVIVTVSISGQGWLFQGLAVATLWMALHVFSQKQDGWLGRIFTTKPFIALGTWSYAVYLVHFLFVTLIESVFKVLDLPLARFQGPWALLFDALLLGVVLLAARWLFLHVEDPARRLIRRWWLEQATARRPAG